MKYPNFFSILIISLLLFNPSDAYALTQTLKSIYNYLTNSNSTIVCDRDCGQDQVCHYPNIAKLCQSHCTAATDKQGYPLKDDQGHPYDGICRKQKDYTLRPSITTPLKPVTQHIAEVIHNAEEQCKIKGAKISTFHQIIAAKFPDKIKEIFYLNAGIREFEKLHGAYETSVHYIWTNDANNSSALEKKVSDYNTNCTKTIDYFTDIFNWAQGIVPVGGYKSLLPGASFAVADGIFRKKVDEYYSRQH